MAITDLTGTKWQLKNDFTASKGYGVFHLIGSISFIVAETGELTSTPFYDSQDNFGIGYQRYPDIPKANCYYYRRSQTAAVFVETNSTYSSATYINITGGNDVTNTRLIAWLEANATQIIEPTSIPTTISYNGTKLASLEEGQTANFNCNGKKAVSNVSILFGSKGSITYKGKTTEIEKGKTANLLCAGKKFATDVVIAVGSGNTTSNFKLSDGSVLVTSDGNTFIAKEE